MATEIVSGINPIYEILRLEKRKVRRIWIAAKDDGGLLAEIERCAAAKKIPIRRVSRQEILDRSKIEKNQGIIAEVDAYKYCSLDDIIKIGDKDPKGHFILVLDNIMDPQNLGSIIRTAHLIGVHGVVIPERNSASVGPASTRASAGAVEHIHIAQVTNIARTLKIFKEKGIWVVGAEAGKSDLYSHVFSGSYALVMGSEGKGIRRLVKESCDELLSIPINVAGGGVNSYNVSVASGIFLSEMSRQRQAKNQ